VRAAIKAHVPDLASQGLGPLRMWYADDFSHPELYPNPLADEVIERLGYRHTWAGPVALSMEEDPHSGQIAPLSAEVRTAVDESAQELEAGVWAALERHAPELLADVMYMSSVTIDGREVFQYKHHDTRRYLNLDLTGQAWWIAGSDDGQMLARPMDLAEAKAHIRLEEEG
jgi:hypothetical protein